MKLFGFNINSKPTPQPVAQVQQDKSFQFSLLGNNKVNYDYNQPLITEVFNTDYIYFGDDNFYPNNLI